MKKTINEKINSFNLKLQNDEINIETYFNEIMKLNVEYDNENVDRFRENLINEKNTFINGNEEIDKIINKTIIILNNENILIPFLPIFIYKNKTLSITKLLTYDEIINNLEDNKIVFLYSISKDDYISTGSIMYRCEIIDK